MQRARRSVRRGTGRRPGNAFRRCRECRILTTPGDRGGRLGRDGSRAVRPGTSVLPSSLLGAVHPLDHQGARAAPSRVCGGEPFGVAFPDVTGQHGPVTDDEPGQRIRREPESDRELRVLHGLVVVARVGSLVGGHVRSPLSVRVARRRVVCRCVVFRCRMSVCGVPSRRSVGTWRMYGLSICAAATRRAGGAERPRRLASGCWFRSSPGRRGRAPLVRLFRHGHPETTQRPPRDRPETTRRPPGRLPCRIAVPHRDCPTRLDCATLYRN